MTLADLMRQTRELLDDFGGDRLANWRTDDSLCQTSNLRLAELLDEARTEYCVRHPIEDEESPLTATLAAVGEVPLDPRILAVRAVANADDGRWVPFVPPEQLDFARSGWPTQTGTVRAWSDVRNDGRSILLLPSPASAVRLRLSVMRLPLEPLAWAHADEEIAEIPAQHQAALRYWAAARVLEGRENAEAAALARRCDALFDLAAGPQLDAATQALRRRVVAGPLRTRVWL